MSWIVILGGLILWVSLGLVVGSIWSRKYVKSRGGYPKYPNTSDYTQSRYDEQTHENAHTAAICSVMFCPVVLVGLVIIGFFYGSYRIITRVALPAEVR
jgi:hypothetical protein